MHGAKVKISSPSYRSTVQTKFLLVSMLIKLEAIPLQASTGPEGSRRLRFPDFKTVGT